MTPTPEEQARYDVDRIITINRELASLDSRVKGLEVRLEERLKTQSRELESLRKDIGESNEKLDSLLRIVDNSKFTWKTFSFVGSIVAAVFAGLVWISTNLGHFFK